MHAPLRISSERGELDVAMVHRYLSEQSYWKAGVALETVRKGMENALCFGGYVGGQQVAFARVVTDYTDFAYLRDVFVLPQYQGRGYGKQLVAAVLNDARLQDVAWMLGTADAHALYARFGFLPLDAPEKYMRRPARKELSK
jgi:GNAT superfamily N-acetyltransferase